MKQKPKTVNKIIPLVVYPLDVMFSAGEDNNVLFRKLTNAGVDKQEVKLADYEETGIARYCLFKSGQSLIRIKAIPRSPQDYGLLQHEIFHCVTAVMWRIGMRLKIKTSDEAYAYLVGYLTEQIYKACAD